MRKFVIILSLMTLIMSPCWSQTITPSSDVSNELKSLLTAALKELKNSERLVEILKDNLATAEMKLQDSLQSGSASDESLKILELQLERAEQQVITLNNRIAELVMQSKQDSIYLSDLKVEIQIQRDKHSEEVKVIITEYDQKIRTRNTVIIVESVVIVILAVVVTLFVVSK